MRCYRCKGEMTEHHVRFDLETDQGLVLIYNVPARVCDQCGERVFGVEVMRGLERIHDKIRQGTISPRPAKDVRQLVYA